VEQKQTPKPEKFFLPDYKNSVKEGENQNICEGEVRENPPPTMKKSKIPQSNH